MKANEQGSHKFWGLVVALLVLVGATVTAMPSSPTLAGPPDPSIPQPEPFYVRLEQPLVGTGVAGEAVSASQVRIAADPGTWYDLVPEEDFDDSSSLPSGWTVDADSGPEWAIHDQQAMSPSHSVGVMATAGAINTSLIYGGETGFAIQDVARAELDFNYWLDIERDSVYFGWAASSDGQSFYGARISGRVGAWLTGVLDMSQYIGDDSVWFAFFVMGEATAGEQNVYVDDVSVQGLEPYRMYLPAAMKNHSNTFTFTDSFSDVNSGWRHKVKWGGTEEQQRYVQGYTDKIMADYSNNYSVIGGDCRKEGRYFMRVGSRDYGAKVIAKAPVQVGSQFTLEADIAFCDDENFSSTGLLFGLNDAQTEYYRVILIYDIGGSIKYAIWRDDSTILKNTSPSSHLEWKKGGFGKNTVKVVRDGCNISVYFNGHKAWSTNSECAYTDQRWVGLLHDKFPGASLTGATVDDFYVDGALKPDD